MLYLSYGQDRVQPHQHLLIKFGTQEGTNEIEESNVFAFVQHFELCRV